MLSAFDHIINSIKCTKRELYYRNTIHAWIIKMESMIPDFENDIWDAYEVYQMIDAHSVADIEDSPYSNSDYQEVLLSIKDEADKTVEELRHVFENIMDYAFFDLLHKEIRKEFYNNLKKEYQNISCDILMIQARVEADYARFKGTQNIQMDIDLKNYKVSRTSAI